MKKNKLFRVLALVLVLAMTVLSPMLVGAAHVVGDINGDGKISVFDAQLLQEAAAGLRELTGIGNMSAQSIVDYILGNTTVDAGDTDFDGVIEIYTAAGLQELRANKTGSFIVMNDIDLAGAEWTPIVGFNGQLNGNGKTISNAVITESVCSGLSSTSAKFNIGFIGDTLDQSVISDLHLRNITITATDETQYMGLLLGSGRGQVTGCTATGTMIDNRATHEAVTYIGALAGRICTPSSGQAVGSVQGGTTLSVTDENGQYTTSGLCAEAAVLIANRENVNTNKEGKIGIVGWNPAAATVSGLWCDRSNSSDLLPDVIQQRQDTAVNYMNAMGTVAWTPTETLVYTCNPNASYNSSRTFKAGTTYYGLPYNHHSGSLERFLTCMESQDENGVYHTETGLGDSIYYVNEAGTGGYDGFIQRMGNDCSTSIYWAWAQISPTRVNVTTETFAGGFNCNSVREMIPNNANRETYGVYPIGSWTTSSYDAETGKVTPIEYDPSLAAYAITDEVSSETILMEQGLDVYLEAYARTHKADGLARCRGDLKVDENGNPILNSNGNEQYSYWGHSRMIAADPVVIRGVTGAIDGDLSYLITTEQGSPTGSTSSWKVNYRRTFNEHAFHNEDSPYNNNGPYLPMTIRALQDEYVKPYYVTPYYKMGGPLDGKFYSNYRFHSVRLLVIGKDGKTVYDQDVYTGITFADTASRSIYDSVALDTLHGEGFAAAEANMVKGQTYYYQVIATLSDGTKVNLNQRSLNESISTFVYE